MLIIIVIIIIIAGDGDEIFFSVEQNFMVQLYP